MQNTQHAKLFRNGRNQALRIPRAFELRGTEALIRKDGDRLIVESAPPRSLLGVLRALKPLAEDFPAIEELPYERRRG